MATSEWPDDASLIAACRRGDGDAWELLIRRWRRLIYSIPSAYRLSDDQADDVFQRVAVKLLENLGRIRDASKLPSWLVTTTRRECLAAKTGSRRWESLDDDAGDALAGDSPDPVAEIHATAREHALALAFERLGDPCRGLLRALYVEDPTPAYGEIARRLGRPIGSLGPTRARCLHKLRKLYLESGGAVP